MLLTLAERREVRFSASLGLCRRVTLQDAEQLWESFPPAPPVFLQRLFRSEQIVELGRVAAFPSGVIYIL